MSGFRHPGRVLAPLLALSWLFVQQWGSFRCTGMLATLIIGILMMSRRQSPAIRAGMLLLLTLLAAWVFVLSGGIRGPNAFRLFIGGMLVFGVGFPLLYALSPPDGEMP